MSCKLAKYNLGLVAVQEVRWDIGGSQPAEDSVFRYGNGNATYVRESYEQLRG